MKIFVSMLSVFMLIAMGCNKAESKLVGTWKSTSMNGFTAEFKKDLTGTTFTPIPGHGGGAATGTAKTPFKWTVQDGGKVKLTEDKETYLGKLVGNKLELEVNGAITILEKVK